MFITVTIVARTARPHRPRCPSSRPSARRYSRSYGTRTPPQVGVGGSALRRMAPAAAHAYDRQVKRLAAWVAALPPRMQDLTLALALAAYNVGSLIPETRQLPLPYAAYASVTLQALPLIWRRRWPVIVFFAVGLPRDFYDRFISNYDPLPLGPAIAYYTVMDRSSTRMRWIISVVLLVGIIRSQLLPGHTEPYDL